MTSPTARGELIAEVIRGHQVHMASGMCGCGTAHFDRNGSDLVARWPVHVGAEIAAAMHEGDIDAQTALYLLDAIITRYMLGDVDGAKVSAVQHAIRERRVEDPRIEEVRKVVRQLRDSVPMLEANGEEEAALAREQAADRVARALGEPTLQQLARADAVEVSAKLRAVPQ